jgi:diguanylate cyclase (GGDEF)-like protein
MTQILIVDDDQDIARILRFRLEKKGYACQTAGNGVEALEVLDRTHPDLVLLDVMMPKLDGFATCRKIRQRKGWARIPVIMLTAKGGTIDKVNGISEGADDYVTKPFEFDELLARIQMILRRTQEHMSANPLTGLPGNQVITRQIEMAIASGKPFAACYADLDHFKPFNDEYGFEAGDQVIQELAEILSTALREGTDFAFLGHIGGDDFFFLVDVASWESRCQEILSRFDAAIPAHYRPEHREKGFIEAQNRQGEVVRYPIMTLSIGVVTNSQRAFTDPMQVSNLASEMKKYAKAVGGSVYRVNRRVVDEVPEGAAAPAPAPPREPGAGPSR